MSLPGTFDHLHDALKALQADQEDMEITSEFLNVLKDDKKEVEREIQEIQDAIPDLKARLESLWADQKVHEYELVSVFMHRGKTSGAGHYWTYQSHLPSHRKFLFL
jgi:ubiquitin carboxyl-terminal hydrolase 25/28